MGGDKHVNFFFGKDEIFPPEHAKRTLSSRHEEAHQQATSHLKVIFDALRKSPKLVPSRESEKFDPGAQTAISTIKQINMRITEENKKLGEDSDTGIIHLDRLCGQWRTGLLESNLEVGQIENSRQWCQNQNYPLEWANLRSWGPANPSSTNTSINQQPSAGGSFLQGNALQPWNSTGRQTRTIAIPPRTTSRSIRPGYTSGGEKITWMQRLGPNGARFVVEDSQGGVRFLSCAAAGGQPALQGAIDHGVPTFTQAVEDLTRLRERVRGGGHYGLFFVALTDWDPSKKTLPFIGTGFWHSDGERGLEEVKVGLSRAALKKVLATEGEHLIAEHMTSQPGTTIKEALHMLCPDVPKPTAPLALPQYPQQQAAPLQLPFPLQGQQGQLEQQIQLLQGQLQQLQLQQPQFQQPQFQQPQSAPMMVQSTVASEQGSSDEEL